MKFRINKLRLTGRRARRFDRLSDRLFGTGGIEGIEVVVSGVEQRGTARAWLTPQCNARSMEKQ
jgi:hypothetical protein